MRNKDKFTKYAINLNLKSNEYFGVTTGGTMAKFVALQSGILVGVLIAW